MTTTSSTSIPMYSPFLSDGELAFVADNPAHAAFSLVERKRLKALLAPLVRALPSPSEARPLGFAPGSEQPSPAPAVAAPEGRKLGYL